MGYREIWMIVCDLCNKDGPTGDTRREATKVAKKRCWLYKLTVHGIELFLCPACAAFKERPDWWPEDP